MENKDFEYVYRFKCFMGRRTYLNCEKRLLNKGVCPEECDWMNLDKVEGEWIE